MSDTVKFPEGSQLSVVKTGDAGETVVVKGFDSIGGTIGSEGKLNTDTVLSDLQVQYGKSALKDAGERELIGRWLADDEGQLELNAAAEDGVMAELEAEKGLRFKAKMGINKDDGVA